MQVAHQCICWAASLKNCSSLRVGCPADADRKGQEIGQAEWQKPVSELTHIDNELLLFLSHPGENCLRVCLSQAWGVQAADPCGGLYGEVGSSQVRTESFQFREFLAPGNGGFYPGAFSLVKGGMVESIWKWQLGHGHSQASDLLGPLGVMVSNRPGHSAGLPTWDGWLPASSLTSLSLLFLFYKMMISLPDVVVRVKWGQALSIPWAQSAW